MHLRGLVVRGADPAVMSDTPFFVFCNSNGRVGTVNSTCTAVLASHVLEQHMSLHCAWFAS